MVKEHHIVLSLHLDMLTTLTTASTVLAAMLVLGVWKGMLQRPSLRLCPSCGRYVKHGHCRCN